ncbi:AraC family transcriptional regulator [bacterium]|nr:AraC family transcriptional regulator [bacterium]
MSSPQASNPASEHRTSVPFEMVSRQDAFPLLSDLYVANIGFWPWAKGHHYVKRRPYPFHSVFYCMSGKGWLEARGRRFTVRRGDAFFLYSDEYFSYAADEQDPWGIAYFRFQGRDARKWMEETGATPDAPVLHVGDPVGFTQRFRELYDLLRRYQTVPALRCAAAGVRHILALMAFRRSLSLPRRAADLHLDGVLDLMESRAGEKLSVPEMAAAAGMSVGHFTRQFKLKTGFSPTDYFIRLKVRKACDLLVSGPTPVAEIARRVGYEDPYYFSKVFKRATNMSPREYRREQGGR